MLFRSLNLITGKFIYITNEKEQLLNKYFKQVLCAYNDIDHNRKNFINYYYVIYMLLAFVDLRELRDQLPVIKNKNRIIEHNQIWRQICDRLNWCYECL